MNKEKLFNKNFVLLWQGMAFSLFGDVLYSVAIGVWVYGQTGSTAWMGIFTSISQFTSMFLMPFTGSLLDRWNKRNILVVCDVIRGVLMIGLGLIALTGNLTLELVLLTAFVAAICNVFFSPSSMALFTSVVAPKFLIRAQSISTGTSSLIALIGKAISGVVVVWLGVPLIILLNGISLLISAITEVFIQIPDTKKVTDKISFKIIFAGMKEGLDYILANKGMATLMIAALLCNLFSSGFYSMFLPLSEIKGLNLTEYGLLTSALSFGGLSATLFIGFCQIKTENQFKVTIASYIISNVLYSWILIFTNGFIPLCIVVFLSQFFSLIANTIMNSCLLISIDESIKGRVLSIFLPFSQGGSALSSVLYGVLSEVFGLPLVVLVGGTLSMLIFVILGFNSSIKELFN